MFSRRWLGAGALAVASGMAAIACGPFFPWQLLDNRAQTLKATPLNSFAFEAAKIATPPKDKLTAKELPPYSMPEDGEAARATAEAAGLTAAQTATLKAAREAASADEAYAKGEGLPEAFRLYAASAVAYHKSDFAGAKARFAAILALGAKERLPRVVWAHYMLGKIGESENDDIAAAKAFRLARTEALKGAPDPLGLAVASYGEEARLHLSAAGALLEGDAAPTNPDSGGTVPDEAAAKYAGKTLPDAKAHAFRKDVAGAVALYSEQAARGSDSGVQSLRITTEFLLASADRIRAVIAEPSLQKLLVAYELRRTRANTITIRHYSYEMADDPTPAAREAGLTVLVDALEKLPHPAGADRLAALCYDSGRWACAKTMAEKQDTPLAAWVKAKLAIQKGDLAGAAKFYAAAARGFPATDSLEEASQKAVLGESSVVALARGDYIDALDKLISVSGTYWPDVAYIAERVLTTEELKAYVDSHIAAVPPPPQSATAPAYETDFNSHAALRDLLARRLMRDGRYAEAQAYFSTPKIRDTAKAYAEALSKADRAWDNVTKAEALFAAATLARKSGLEMMGSEGPPDSFYTGGNFEEGLGRAKLEGGPFITAGERARFAASTAKPNQRFHYRYVAIDQAAKAADLVPAKSQAFAAILCHATNWASRDDAKARALWQRYVKQGARVPFAKTFGSHCPAPDFASAQALEHKIMLRHARRFVSRNRWWFVSGGLGSLALVGLGAGLAIWRWRRRKTA